MVKTTQKNGQNNQYFGCFDGNLNWLFQPICFYSVYIQISRETMLLLINNLHKNVRDNCSFNLRL